MNTQKKILKTNNLIKQNVDKLIHKNIERVELPRNNYFIQFVEISSWVMK